MKEENKLTHRVASEQEAQHHARQEGEREFGSVEELLQYDAGQTEAPPGIARRLAESLGEPRVEEPKAWWKRIFRR